MPHGGGLILREVGGQTISSESTSNWHHVEQGLVERDSQKGQNQTQHNRQEGLQRLLRNLGPSSN